MADAEKAVVEEQEEARAAILSRWDRMRLNLEMPLGELVGGEPDIEFLLDSLRPGQLPAALAKTLGSLVWGVLPTADWQKRWGSCHCRQYKTFHPRKTCHPCARKS